MSSNVTKLMRTTVGFGMIGILAACGGSPSEPAKAPGRNSQLMAVETPPPAYPLAQFCDQIGGIVELQVTVGTEGTVTESKIAKTSGVPELDTAAQEATLKYKFEPAYVNGNPVSRKIHVPVNFNPAGISDARCKAGNKPT